MFLGLFKSLKEKIEEDKVKIVKKLKSSDIKTLVKEMGNNKPLSKNVAKLRKPILNSDEMPSWFAYKVSNELNDSNQKSELINLLSNKDFIDYKKHILRCLSSLCVNTNDYELFDFLISEIKKSDEDEEIISHVLLRLEDMRKPSFLDIEYLKYLLVNGTFENRNSALKALSNCEHKDLEDLLLKEFVFSNQEIKHVICSILMNSGTEKSLEILKTEYKRTRSDYYRQMIERTIEIINIRNEIDN